MICDKTYTTLQRTDLFPNFSSRTELGSVRQKVGNKNWAVWKVDTKTKQCAANPHQDMNESAQKSMTNETDSKLFVSHWIRQCETKSWNQELGNMKTDTQGKQELQEPSVDIIRKTRGMHSQEHFDSNYEAHRHKATIRLWSKTWLQCWRAGLLPYRHPWKAFEVVSDL